VNSASIDLFVATCEDHRIKMVDVLACEASKVHVVRTGVDCPEGPEGAQREPADRFVVGYLSSILPVKGLDLLVHALQGSPARLLVAGKVLDRKYFQSIDGHRFEYLGELNAAEKAYF